MDDLDPSDATERFRARVAARPIPMTPPARRSIAPWIVAALLLVFALGLIANPWFERSVRSQLPGFAAVDAPADLRPLAARLDTLEARLRAVEARPAGTVARGGPDERVAALDARLGVLERAQAAATARVDTLTNGVAALTGRVDASAGQTVLTLQAARADADRAQGALAVLAARRAVEGGRAAPGLEGPLRTLFASRLGPAVDAVGALLGAPATPGSLRAGLARLRGGSGTAPRGWWDSLTAGFADIVTVSDRAGTGDLYAQADAALAAGDAVRAEALVARAPASAARDQWLAASRRLRAGQAGLAALDEAAAVVRPTLP